MKLQRAARSPSQSGWPRAGEAHSGMQRCSTQPSRGKAGSRQRRKGSWWGCITPMSWLRRLEVLKHYQYNLVANDNQCPVTNQPQSKGCSPISLSVTAFINAMTDFRVPGPMGAALVLPRGKKGSHGFPFVFLMPTWIPTHHAALAACRGTPGAVSTDACHPWTSTVLAHPALKAAEKRSCPALLGRCDPSAHCEHLCAGISTGQGCRSTALRELEGWTQVLQVSQAMQSPDCLFLLTCKHTAWRWIRTRVLQIFLWYTTWL